MIMTSNSQTIQAYENSFIDFVSATADVTSPLWKSWIASILDFAPEDEPILEIGSGFGRDADYLEEIGMVKVWRTDAASSAVRWLHNHGFEAEQLNVLTDEIPGMFGTIFAAAVFHHFTDDEVTTALEKIRYSLVPGGITAFIQRRGSRCDWIASKNMPPRYFHCREPKPLWEMTEAAGFQIRRIDCFSHGNILDEFPEESRWVGIIGQVPDE